MIATFSNWREYQEAVATFFRERGCHAEVEAPIQGARAAHKIDVFVTFRQHGIDVHWAVECKLWKGNVEKGDVLTLKGVVDDIGADRGIIFCESGFQSGARDAARHTNILLITSLEDFARTVELDDSSSPLIQRDANDPAVPPIYAFPNGDQPHELLVYDSRVFVGNWQPGNIAIVDAATKRIQSVIELDKYKAAPNVNGKRTIAQYPPGEMACADGKLFVGQVFSDFVLVIDIETQSIIKRIALPGGGDGAIAASPDGRQVYFASNRRSCMFLIDSATYEYEEVAFPSGGRGSLCTLRHPSKPLLYIGIQRGGTLNGKNYAGGNCFLATYDLEQRRYIGNLYLAEVHQGTSDDGTPHSLLFDEKDHCLYIGMFQSRRGICRVDELGQKIQGEYRFSPNIYNKHFLWVDPLNQALYDDQLLTVNRNNRELVSINKGSGQIVKTVFLGDATNGPGALVVVGGTAIVGYGGRGGLIFHNLNQRG